jgi:hypothetical protein
MQEKRFSTMQVSPFSAWMRSLPIALGVPAFVFLICMLIELALKPSSGGFSLLFFVMLGASILVHFVSYLLIGFPIFFAFHRKLDSKVWRLSLAIPFGLVVGSVAIFAVLYGMGYNESALQNPQIYFIGAGYGLITALSACKQRPKANKIAYISAE